MDDAELDPQTSDAAGIDQVALEVTDFDVETPSAIPVDLEDDGSVDSTLWDELGVAEEADVSEDATEEAPEPEQSEDRPSAQSVWSIAAAAGEADEPIAAPMEQVERTRLLGDNFVSAPATRRKYADRLLKLTAFLVPAVGSFIIAMLLLRYGKPFDDRLDFGIWVLTVVVIAIVVAKALSILVERALMYTRLYSMASNFNEEMDSRFRSALRAGSARSRISTDKALSVDEQAEYLMQLLSDMNRHERLTRGHIERVRAYSTLIGEELGFSEAELAQLSWSALLHDMGKLDVPAVVLQTPDEPTEAQWTILRLHPNNARSYLEPLESWLGPSMYDAAEYHHENWDGTGYPNQLAGDQIPLIARIVAVADAFDVMTHARSYKKPHSIDFAREELVAGAGSQFDPTVVAAFLRIGNAKLAHVRGWAVTFAGLSVAADSSVLSGIATSTVVGGSILAGLLSAGVSVPEDSPPAIAFEEVVVEDATPETVDDVVETTTTTTTSTTTTITPTTEPGAEPTTSLPPRDPSKQVLSFNYRLQAVLVDDIYVNVSGDTLAVYVDDVLVQEVPVASGATAVAVTLDVGDFALGVYEMRLDLLNGSKVVSSETRPLVR